MFARSQDALEDAQLTAAERRVVARLLTLLEGELGEHLLAVWLFGSRARREADLTQTHHDRRSDVDLMVVVDPAAGWDPHGSEVIPLINRAAEAEGDDPVWYSVLVYDSARLRERRRIRSFFVQEIDRDKVVLAGSGLEDAGREGEPG